MARLAMCWRMARASGIYGERIKVRGFGGSMGSTGAGSRVPGSRFRVQWVREPARARRAEPSKLANPHRSNPEPAICHLPSVLCHPPTHDATLAVMAGTDWAVAAGDEGVRLDKFLAHADRLGSR